MDVKPPVFSMVSELPKTKKNLEEQARREALLKQLEEDKLQQQKFTEDQLRQRQNEELKREYDRLEALKRRAEEEQRRKEEEEQKSSLEGKLAKFIGDLKYDATTAEYSLSGIEMSNVKWRILGNSLAHNTTLKELHLARKGIQDDEGMFLMENLKQNNVLEKLELEGNRLGVTTLTALGEYLAKNDTLKYLDLEGNELFDSSIRDMTGVHSLIEGIRSNQCLQALNLTDCGLDTEPWELIAQVLRENFTLIHLDFRSSDLRPETKRRLVTTLERNQAIYDKLKFREWKERKFMRREDEYTEMIDITLQQEDMKHMNILSREEANRREKDQRWQEEKLKKDYDMKRDIEKLINEAKKRQEAGKKKRKRGAKKK